MPLGRGPLDRGRLLTHTPFQGTTLMNEPTSRFLDAFNVIEEHFRRTLRAEPAETFSLMLERAARSSSVVRRYKDDLKLFGNLRNFIIHRYKHENPVAVPSDNAVERLAQIASALTSPPKLIDQATRDVVDCCPSDPVGVAAKKMYEGGFSQLPVCDGRVIHAILTSDTVARWLAVQLASGLGMLEEQTVAEVLRSADPTRTYKLMGRETTIDTALEQFDEHLRRGQSLEAIILTDKGKAGEVPLGIATIADVPRLLRVVDPPTG